jgi:hypothetical protein
MTTDETPLTPEDRARLGASGVPVVLSDGDTWLLADGGLCNELDDLRDRIDDECRLTGQVDMLDIANVAFRLLNVNYDLSDYEASQLIVGAKHEALSKAVMEALYGPEHPRRTYTSWAAAAMVANGIDPGAVPSSLRPHVLAQLEAMGRCIKRSEYIESAEAARRFAAKRARVRPAIETPTPEA